MRYAAIYSIYIYLSPVIVFPILLICSSLKSSHLAIPMPSKILLMAATLLLLLLDTIFLTLLSIYLILSSSASGVQSATFTLMNQCSYPVWPGLLSGAGTPQLSTTGFALQPGHSNSLFVPPSWSGRLWGRTLCTLDSTGKFTCATADCGSGTLECAGAGGAPPATLAEFTLNGAGGMDFYDVSLVDGYNLPMMVVPRGGTAGNCTATGCGADLNGSCPLELKVSSGGGESESVACKSACEAFGDPKYCCSGEYGTPDTCRPSCYSEYFKSACPDAYSYAYDDGTSTFTCASSADYVITFCPSPAAAGRKSSGSPPLVPDGSLASTATKLGFSSGIIITVLVCVLATIWPVYWPCHASSSPASQGLRIN